jgi:methylthioribose-1-phosphate isomerase
MTEDVTITPLRWEGRGLSLLDQRLLPTREEYVLCETDDAVAAAIAQMVVRGAPAIGIAGAYGAVLAARSAYTVHGERWRDALPSAFARLQAARPTAVNLAWAIERMSRLIPALADGDPTSALLAEARAIEAEDLAANRRMGELGGAYVAHGSRVMTHCNAGALATAGYGTALGVIRHAHAAGKGIEVFATETRPWLQGARLTAWELSRDGIPVRLITDGSAAHVMRQAKISWVIVGADRIAANGDVANKIGTFTLALAARALGVRFMVVAPLSTVDLATPSGSAIPIEERPGDEVLSVAGTRFAAPGVAALNPVFDVTPAALVDVLVTEAGVLERPGEAGLSRLVRTARGARD